MTGLVGIKRCTSKRKDGQPCKRAAIRGRERCGYHGGKAARGILAPRYGHLKAGSPHAPGHTSKYIPAKLAADYAKAKHDPEKLSVLHEIATWTAREQALLRRFEPHDPGSAWQTLSTAWSTMEDAKTALDTAQQHRDIPAMRQAYARFQTALDTGRQAISTAQTDYGLWEEVRKVHAFTAHLKAQEHKRLLDLQRYWNAEQIAARWGQFLHALWESSMFILPKDYIRPFLNDFSNRIKALDAEFHAMEQAVTPDPSP